MASNKRTIHLGLDYTQFTGGITEVNRKMGILDAEFKLATEQAKNYGTETDQLGLKQEYLAQKIALQNQKVEEARRAYEAAANSQNASQKEVDNLQKKFLQESIFFFVLWFLLEYMVFRLCQLYHKVIIFYPFELLCHYIFFQLIF